MQTNKKAKELTERLRELAKDYLAKSNSEHFDWLEEYKLVKWIEDKDGSSTLELAENLKDADSMYLIEETSGCYYYVWDFETTDKSEMFFGYDTSQYNEKVRKSREIEEKNANN